MMRYTSRGGFGGIDVRDVAKAVERLAEYEDTQLEPDEIERLQKSLRLLREMLKTMITTTVDAKAEQPREKQSWMNRTSDRTYEVTEFCSNCEREVTMKWDTDTDGLSAFCPFCGERLMLCDECQHATGGGMCDYDNKTDSCRFSEKQEGEHES